jgi:type I restriction enzyme S subunit
MKVSLDEVAQWGLGGTPSRKNPDYFVGDIPWLKTGELGQKYIRQTEEKISQEAVNSSAAKLFPKGSVCIAMYGATIGKASILCIDATTNQACAVAQPLTGVLDAEFLYYFFISEKPRFIEAGIGGAQPNISQGLIKSWPFTLPPLAEQKRIVAKIEELFSELDAGEESLRVARRQLGVYRQSLLKQAFEGKLTAQWRTQHPDLLSSPDQLLARIQAERQARYQQQLKEWEKAVKEWEEAATDEKRPPKPQKLTPSNDSIPVFDVDFPTGWCVLNLFQFVLELGQGWSPKCENRPAEDGEWAVIKTTAIQSGDFAPSANKALPKHLPPRRWLALRAGEILITRAGPRSRCGVVCRVRADQPQLMLCDKAYRLVLSESATSSEYVERLLCSPAAMAAIEELKTGINDSGVNITQTAFLQLALPIPSLPEQQEIVRLLDEQFEVIERNESEIDAALRRSEALRQAILKKAFTGQLVPQDSDDEPASVLLACIRAQKQPKPIKQSKKNA